MARYINTEIAGAFVSDFVCEEMKKIPTADVVKVVRCKDCKHYCANYCTRDIKGRTSMFYMNADDFCSNGERKDT